jgi:hypothetical protein
MIRPLITVIRLAVTQGVTLVPDISEVFIITSTLKKHLEEVKAKFD